jgi:hypothetical protein
MSQAVKKVITLTPRANKVIATRHIELLTGSADTPVCARMLHPGDGSARKLSGTIEDLWPTILDAQAKGFDAYVVVSEGGQRGEDITQIRAVFVDADGIPIPKTWHLEPSFLVVRDATHWHAYWLTDDVTVAQFSEVQKRLAARYSTDPAVHDISRVMRLAGTLHQKAEPILVTLEERDGRDEVNGLYVSRQLTEGLPPAPVKTAPVTTAPDVELDLPGNVRRAITHVKSLPAVTIGQRSDDACYKAACVMKDMAVSPQKANELLMEHFKCEPKDPAWVAAKVDSAYRNGQNAPGVYAARPASQVFAGAVAKLGGTSSRLISRAASEIEPERIEWVWKNRFPRGKLSLLAGDGGLGKTTALLDIAARVSRGREWPCSEGDAPCGSVIYFSAEDDAADTLVPRLMAAGADRSKIHIVEAVRDEDGDGNRTFHLHADLNELERLIEQLGDVVLVIFDPISSYFGKTDTYRNTEVRGVLEPVVKMAARRDLAIVGNTHLAKGAKGRANMRVLDSVAMTAAVRSVYMVIEDANDPKRRLFLPSKGNLGPPVEGLSFTVVSKTVSVAKQITGSFVVWDSETVVTTADEALGAMEEKTRTPTAVDEAVAFLRDHLAEGPKPSAEVYDAGRACGHSLKTLRRAHERLGIVPGKRGMDGGWTMRLPDKG